MTESERYEAGRRILSTMLGEAAAEASAEKMHTLHPEFERLVMTHVMHDLYGRAGLDIKTRLLCTIAALTVLGRPEQLAVRQAGTACCSHRPSPWLWSHEDGD